MKAVMRIQGALLDVETGRVTHLESGTHLGDVDLESVEHTDEGLAYVLLLPSPIVHLRLDFSLRDDVRPEVVPEPHVSEDE